MVIYFVYGYSNSNLAKPKIIKSPEERAETALENPSFESTTDDDPFAYDVLILSPSKTDMPYNYRTEWNEKDLM